jgi:Protein of unknown function (DUF4038)/Putative collagen-binding domain of a collagenase
MRPSHAVAIAATVAAAVAVTLTGADVGVARTADGAVSGASRTVTGTGQADSATDFPWFRAVSDDGRYLVDQTGAPIPLFTIHQWNLVARAGEHDELGPGTTPQAVFQDYCRFVASKDFNAVLALAVSSDQGGVVGSPTDGRTWDGIKPWGPGGIGDLNEPYWQRVDQLVDACGAEGVTVILNLVSSYTLYPGTAFADLNTTNGGAYGTAIGNRYKDKPNIIYHFGTDYFGTYEEQFAAIADAIQATGDTHLIALQNFPESNTRTSSPDGQPVGSFGNSRTISYDDVYSYNASYVELERDWGLTSPEIRPTVFMNGHYDQSGSDSQHYDWHVYADNLGWGLTTGSKGFYYQAEGIWKWEASSWADLQTLSFLADGGPWPSTVAWFEALNGWWNLVPDIGSSFITSSRGTPLPQIPSGGKEYNAASPQNDYLTGAVTADGTLALLYTPVARTISIDGSRMASQYTASWIDPYDGSRTPATPSATSYTTPPSGNSGGDDNWYLALEADPAPAPSSSPTPSPSPEPSPSTSTSPSTSPEPSPSSEPSSSSSPEPSPSSEPSPTPSSEPSPSPSLEPSPTSPTAATYTATAELSASSWIQLRRAAFLDGQIVLSYACTDCGEPMRTIEIQGRLGDGSWRTLTTQTYQYSEELSVRVPYKFEELRVTAPEIQVDADTYAEVVSNSIPVPSRWR